VGFPTRDRPQLVVAFHVLEEYGGSAMLHLDDEGGDHSVFLSLDLIALIEFPLIALKRRMETELGEDTTDETAELDAGTKPRRPCPNTKDEDLPSENSLS
jgi:hypothetical protein